MASKSSKSLPFLVLAIVITTLFAESYFEIEIDLESFLPVLIPLGVTGAGLAAVKAAAEAKKQIPKEILEGINNKIDSIYAGLKKQ